MFCVGDLRSLTEAVSDVSGETLGSIQGSVTTVVQWVWRYAQAIWRLEHTIFNSRSFELG